MLDDFHCCDNIEGGILRGTGQGLYRSVEVCELLAVEQGWVGAEVGLRDGDGSGGGVDGGDGGGSGEAGEGFGEDSAAAPDVEVR